MTSPWDQRSPLPHHPNHASVGANQMGAIGTILTISVVLSIIPTVR